jgi:hypothetical protein
MKNQNTLNRNTKYFLVLLLVIVICTYFTSVTLEKRTKVKTIDTVMCNVKEYYGEDTLTGEKYLILVQECDTIYEK